MLPEHSTGENIYSADVPVSGSSRLVSVDVTRVRKQNTARFSQVFIPPSELCGCCARHCCRTGAQNHLAAQQAVNALINLTSSWEGVDLPLVPFALCPQNCFCTQFLFSRGKTCGKAGCILCTCSLASLAFVSVALHRYDMQSPRVDALQQTRVHCRCVT